MIRDLASHIKGGGGGQAFFASAGGSDPAGIEKALETAKEILNL
jgi:alanyl-tRNA synthetase